MLYLPSTGTSLSRGDLLEFLGDTCEQITSMDPNNIIVIGGDLNELKYKDLLTQASLAQLVKEPTRKNKILDVFITNKLYLWSKTKVIKSAVRTDHQMVLACPKDHVKADCYTKAFRDVREHYKIKMFKLLEEYKWSSVLSTQCIQEKVQNFQFALMQMYNDCFPVKTVLMSSRDPPFMSPLVKHLLKRRQALLRKGGQRHNPNVTILQERINKLIRENQLQAVKNDSNKHDKGTRSWWSTINSVTGRKPICQSTSSIIDPASINEYFGEINTDPGHKGTLLHGA